MEHADLKGKTAIVTGSATGIGASVAIGLARRGANIVVNYSKSAKEAEETTEKVRKEGVDARLVQGNVAEDADCRKMAKTALDAWGRIDILVNNAGTTRIVEHRNLEGLSDEDFIRMYSVNVIGGFHMIRACAEALRAGKDGSVVNVSSTAGLSGTGSSVAYAASKGALNTMTLSLAKALAPEIRVNAVCPGFVATRWFSDLAGEETFKKMVANMEATLPLKRAADADEIAKTVLFLCGPESRHLTGELIRIDAGRHLGG